MTRSAPMDPQKLYHLARDKSEEGHQRLADHVVTMMAETKQETHRSLAGEILVEIMKHSMQELRHCLATQLASMVEAPINVIEYLANDPSIEVAEPVLMQSPLLSDAFLIDIASARSAPFWRAIARREELSPSLTMVLVGMGDIETYYMIIANQNNTIDPETYQWLGNLARYEESLQKPILSRHDLPKDVAVDMYWFIANSLRNEIEKRFVINPDIMEKALSRAITHQMGRVQRKNKFERMTDGVSIEDRRLARRLWECRMLKVSTVFNALSHGNIPFYTALMGEITQVDAEWVQTVLDTKDVKAFACLCHKARLTITDFTKMYLVLFHQNPQKSHDYLKRTEALTKALDHFRGLNQKKTAKGLEGAPTVADPESFSSVKAA